MRCLTPFIILFLCLNSYKARTLKTGQQFPHKTIKSALSDAKAGDTIEVYSGKYTEGNITVDKSVHLIGVGAPVVDGEDKFEIFTVTADHVRISGFKLTGSGKSSLNDLAAIKIVQAENVIISRNELPDNTFAIYLSACRNCVVSSNKIKGSGLSQQLSGNGIHLWKCNKIKITDNEIRGHRDGIYFEFVTESSIVGNISEENLRYGLHFMFSDNDTYEKNVFRNNGAGVAVMYTSKVTMKQNLFDLNWGSGSYGILLKDIRDSEISGNIFKSNTTAIFAESVSRVKIDNNQFLSNGWALRMTSSSDQVSITKNNFIGNTFDMSSNSVSQLTQNTYDGNYWDKYEGYDLNKDRTGDIPFYPVSLSTMLVEKNSVTSYFLHSFVLDLINRSENMLPVLTPEGIKDNTPAMKKFNL